MSAGPPKTPVKLNLGFVMNSPVVHMSVDSAENGRRIFDLTLDRSLLGDLLAGKANVDGDVHVWIGSGER